MTVDPAAPVARCCAQHDDWQTLAAHLVLEFDGVAAHHVVRELTDAREAVEGFGLDDAGALACAELIVRNRTSMAALGSGSVTTAPLQRRM